MPPATSVNAAANEAINIAVNVSMWDKILNHPVLKLQQDDYNNFLLLKHSHPATRMEC